ncbi:tRNA (adenosine(37)-N6)-threonylcarbamoyltransferase complex dimerization subunit type 1 TsaB [Amphritea sp. HPY]|uniref:tRNA (adenosine(37)-N6)-threonylcarbamoyltransferase complex dimerization subunit type 1 TsaB n=1 Tax=Amphritea sp. HPY TaxID=3421652 RepID=UPI003D7CAA30
MAKILALDTSTDACSVALYIDGEVREDFRIIPRQHTKQLLPMVSEILDQAGLKVSQLDAVAFGRGPGSFAGIRIATGVAQGLAFAAQLPVIPVSTLAAIALVSADKYRVERIVSTLDARMNELYSAAYEIRAGLPVLLDSETVSAPQDIVLPEIVQPDGGNWFAAGKGWLYLEDMPAAVKDAVSDPVLEIYPTAAAMVRIAAEELANGRTVKADDALPVYLRDEVAWKKKDQQKKKHQQ